MCKKLSKEHKAVILEKIETQVQELENHIDKIIGKETTEVEPCRTAKTGKMAKKKK
jgi:hypothetical protein